METPVTERAFLEYLHELNHKISYLYEKSPSEIKCFNEVHDILYKLKIKVNSDEELMHNKTGFIMQTIHNRVIYRVVVEYFLGH